MPVSTSVQLSDCMQEIVRLQPQSVLDIGCGFGQWGFLCREHLDVWNGRVQPADWQVRIEGVELWEPYIMAHQRALYDEIHIGDVREILPKLGTYELVIAGDVIEHLDKPDAEWVVEELYDRAEKALLINIPLTGDWDHPIQHGNPGELHRSQWVASDFAAYPAQFREYRLGCGEYGSFFCAKDCSSDARLAGLQHAAERRLESGDRPGALRALHRAHALAPADPLTVFALTDLLLQDGDRNGAVAVLQEAVDAQPAFHEARLHLARLHHLAGASDRAAHELQTLLDMPDLDPTLRAQAEEFAAKVRG